MKGSIATILPSTIASKSKRPSTSNDCGKGAHNNSQTRIRLLVATSALVLMPITMLKEALEAERREEIQFGGGKVARVT